MSSEIFFMLWAVVLLSTWTTVVFIAGGSQRHQQVKRLQARLDSQNKILTVKANKVQELEDELVAQAVSRDTYYREWEERANKQLMLIESLRNKVNEVTELRQKLEEKL